MPASPSPPTIRCCTIFRCRRTCIRSCNSGWWATFSGKRPTTVARESTQPTPPTIGSMPSVARQLSSCQPGRRAWASSYSRNSRTGPQSRDIHFRLWGVSHSERRGGKMKSRMMREKAREAMLSSAWCKQFMQALVAILLFSAIAAAQQEPEVGGQTEDLQKATQNPVSNLISVPLQNNTNFGVNPGNRNQDVLNIQPVIPIGISKNWNLLVRWMTPIIYQPVPNAPRTPETGAHGLADSQQKFSITP